MLSRLRKLQLACIVAIAATGIAGTPKTATAQTQTCEYGHFECPIDLYRFCLDRGCQQTLAPSCSASWPFEMGGPQLIMCAPF